MNLTIKKYIYLTPMTYFLAFFLYQVVLIPALSWNVLSQLSLNHALMAGGLSFIFLMCVFLGWLLSKKMLQDAFNGVMSFFSLRGTGKKIHQKYFGLLALVYFVLFIASFVLLAYLSGAGTLWITDSRTAYQLYRNGVGIFYATTVSLLTLSYTLAIYGWTTLDNFLVKAIPITLVFSSFAFFLGAKSLIVGLFIILLVFYSYHIKAFSMFQVAVLFMLSILSVSLLQIVQGTAETAKDTILYADYFYTTTEFLRRFSVGDFDLQFGSVLISNIWAYIPRILYPDKPYEYGQLLINKVIFPGAAELGFSPGLLPWAAIYLDFGIFGVIFYGILTGCLLGWTHRFYVDRNVGIVDFWILLKLGGFPAFFAFFPMPVFIAIILPCLSLSVFASRKSFYRMT